MEDSADEIEWLIVTSWVPAPMSRANRSRAASSRGIHAFHQAGAPYADQSSRYCSSAASTRRLGGPSEQLFRYVVRSKMGNSERYFAASSSEIPRVAISVM